MPRKSSKKKPFIDKKKSVTFQLVHRSLKDPLAADDDAPQRVLVPVGGTQKIPDSVSEVGTYEYEEMISERKKYGIGFEDDYNYMQHLRIVSETQPAILVPKSKHSVVEIEEGDDGMSEILRDNKPILKLPSEVFGSTVEESVGLLFRAIPPVGPQPSWDPDIVAGMDDDFDFNNPDNQLDDDFVVQAANPGDDVSQTSEDLMESDIESCDSNKISDFDDTKSQFTHYSLTSSVIRRNEQLTLLDDKFERFFESYQDSNMGDLSQMEIEGVFPVENLNEVKGMRTLLGIKGRKKQNNLKENDKPEWNKHYVYQPNSSNDESDDMETIVKEEIDKKWDCETILSTYSTLYNHPKLIEEKVLPKVKVSGKTGIPLGNHPRLTKQQLRILNNTIETSNTSHAEESMTITHPGRKKGESKEEKKIRKQLVKEAKKDRRMEKKATKVAFQEEKSRQKKELMNIQQNLNGIRIS